MEAPRLKAGIWVAAALRLGQARGKPGMLLRRGDDDAGGILVILRGRSGNTLLSQFRDTHGRLAWMQATGPTPVDDQATESYVDKRIAFDGDLWVIEFEAPDYLPPFDGKII